MRRRCSLPNPASSAALGIELCAWSLAYTTSGASSACRPPRFWLKAEVRSRAQSSAVNVDVLAVSSMTPVKVVGEVDHLAQPVHDDVLDLRGRRTGEPAHALHAEPGPDEVGEHRREVAVAGEVGEEPGVVPVRDPRHDDAVEVGDDACEVAALLRWLGGHERRHLARLHAAHHRQLADALAVVGDPVDQLVAERAELVGIHRCSQVRCSAAHRTSSPGDSTGSSLGADGDPARHPRQHLGGRHRHQVTTSPGRAAGSGAALGIGVRRP